MRKKISNYRCQFPYSFTLNLTTMKAPTQMPSLRSLTATCCVTLKIIFPEGRKFKSQETRRIWPIFPTLSTQESKLTDSLTSVASHRFNRIHWSSIGPPRSGKLKITFGLKGPITLSTRLRFTDNQQGGCPLQDWRLPGWFLPVSRPSRIDQSQATFTF